MQSPSTGDSGKPNSSPSCGLRRRRQWLLYHMAAYFAVVVVAVPINAMTDPGNSWFLIPMVGWGAPLAIHTAWVLELFGRPKD